MLACTELRIRHGRLLLRKHAQEAYLPCCFRAHDLSPGDLKDGAQHSLLARVEGALVAAPLTDMRDRLYFFLISALCASCYAAGASSRTINRDALSASDLLKLVNPFIGTANGGNVFPGEF